jgi:hypothetical protein
MLSPAVAKAAVMPSAEPVSEADPAARQDMPRWFSPTTFDGMESVFRHHLSDAGWAALRRHVREHAHRYRDRWWEGDPFEERE